MRTGDYFVAVDAIIKIAGNRISRRNRDGRASSGLVREAAAFVALRAPRPGGLVFAAPGGPPADRTAARFAHFQQSQVIAGIGCPLNPNGRFTAPHCARTLPREPLGPSAGFENGRGNGVAGHSPCFVEAAGAAAFVYSGDSSPQCRCASVLHARPLRIHYALKANLTVSA